jgi:hypothetical protein
MFRRRAQPQSRRIVPILAGRAFGPGEFIADMRFQDARQRSRTGRSPASAPPPLETGAHAFEASIQITTQKPAVRWPQVSNLWSSASGCTDGENP